MKATIYHNPLCGTSRKTLEILQESGAEVEVIDYLKAPPSKARLADLYARAGLSPRDGLRMKEPEAQAVADWGDAAVLDAMTANPRLIERPIVATNKGVRLCRPQDKVREIL